MSIHVNMLQIQTAIWIQAWTNIRLWADERIGSHPRSHWDSWRTETVSYPSTTWLLFNYGLDSWHVTQWSRIVSGCMWEKIAEFVHEHSHRWLDSKWFYRLISGYAVSCVVNDCLQVSFAEFFYTMDAFSPRWLFARIGCAIGSLVTFFAGCSNMHMLCVISIDRWRPTSLRFSMNKRYYCRYLLINKGGTLSVFNVERAYKCIGCIYALVSALTVMPLIGWSSYDFEVKTSLLSICHQWWVDHV